MSQPALWLLILGGALLLLWLQKTDWPLIRLRLRGAWLLAQAWTLIWLGRALIWLMVLLGRRRI